MVCLIPEKGLYVGYTHSLCISSEIDSLLKSGLISSDDYPHLVALAKDIDNAFYCLD